MNLYKFYNNPKQLLHYKDRKSLVSSYLMDKIEGDHIAASDKIPEDTFSVMDKKTISNDARLSFSFAALIVQDRWPPGEAAILKDSEYAAYYAIDIMQDRWQEAERIIYTDPDTQEYYEEGLDDLGITPYVDQK